MKEIDDMTVSELRDSGHAVAIFTPGELRDADPGEVADIMIARGWTAIDTLGG